MIRGTTPTLVFNVNSQIDLTKIDKAYLTINQNGTNVLELSTERLTAYSQEHTIAATLTQNETLSLGEGFVLIQLRLLMTDGTAMASKVIRTDVDRILKGGTI